MPASNATHRCRPGSSVFVGLNQGKLSKPALPGDLFSRLAVVMPWVQDACGAAGCSRLQVLPPSFDAWLISAAANAEIADFLIVHEPSSARLFANRVNGINGINGSSSNVRLVAVPSLAALYARRLNFSDGARLMTSQKIKDCKPMIGHVFADQLRGYSHWAFGDVDVVRARASRCQPESTPHAGTALTRTP